MDMAAAPVELSRREREAVEAQRKKDHYMKLHAEGKTQEAQVRTMYESPVRRTGCTVCYTDVRQSTRSSTLRQF